MSVRRLRPLSNPVTITLDGEPLQAERGEPVAAALIAAEKLTIARSPKFHRPRGPACFRGACDGCLARVNEAPNVMTCMVPAEEGTAVVSQNRLGPRDADLLRMTDWFFPEGMNHHELFAGIPGVQTIMQSFARRVAGLGKLPEEQTPQRSATRREIDVLVVGAGASGMAVTMQLLARDPNCSIEVIDDQLAPGGGLTALGDAAFESMRASFLDLAREQKNVRLRLRTTAGAMYGRDVLVAGSDGAEIVTAKAIVLAVGAHDGALPFEGNDVPGVMSARAAGWLLSLGVRVGDKIAIVVPPHGGPFGESFAKRASSENVELVHGEPIAIKGSRHAKGVRVRLSGSGEEKTLKADVVLIDAPRSPAYELCEQAGAKLAFDRDRGFIVQTNAGKIVDGIFASGEVCGVPLDARAIEENARMVAQSVVDERAKQRDA